MKTLLNTGSFEVLTETGKSFGNETDDVTWSSLV